MYFEELKTGMSVETAPAVIKYGSKNEQYKTENDYQII